MNPWYIGIQSVIAWGVFFTILLNGMDKLYGWLLGALIQCVQMIYGYVTQQYGYLFAVVPCVAFLIVFHRKWTDSHMIIAREIKYTVTMTEEEAADVRGALTAALDEDLPKDSREVLKNLQMLLVSQ